MILDTLDQADRYASLHPGFAPGFAFLREAPLAELQPGRHEIDGERVFAIVATDEGRGRDGARLEAHRRYIDIQLVVEGNEVIGWSELTCCTNVESPYDAEKDIVFFRDRPATWMDLAPGHFCIFFPEDAHAPLAGQGLVRKIVVKVAA